jgi:hypothetical protein
MDGNFIPANLRFWRWPHAVQMTAGPKQSKIVRLKIGQCISWRFGDYQVTIRRVGGKRVKLDEYRKET